MLPNRVNTLDFFFSQVRPIYNDTYINFIVCIFKYIYIYIAQKQLTAKASTVCELSSADISVMLPDYEKQFERIEIEVTQMQRATVMQ